MLIHHPLFAVISAGGSDGEVVTVSLVPGTRMLKGVLNINAVGITVRAGRNFHRAGLHDTRLGFPALGLEDHPHGPQERGEGRHRTAQGEQAEKHITQTARALFRRFAISNHQLPAPWGKCADLETGPSTCRCSTIGNHGRIYSDKFIQRGVEKSSHKRALDDPSSVRLRPTGSLSCLYIFNSSAQSLNPVKLTTKQAFCKVRTVHI